MSVGNSEAATVSLQRKQVLLREDVVIHKMNFLAYYYYFFWSYQSYWSSQVALVVKNPPANAGDIRDMSLIPGLGRSPGGGRGNPLQYSCLEKPMGRGAWQATDHGVAKSQI